MHWANYYAGRKFEGYVLPAISGLLYLHIFAGNFWMTSKYFLFLIFSCLMCVQGMAQETGDYLFHLQSDFVKTDNAKLFAKAQIGAEVNYFVTDKITGSAGFEVWTGDEFSFVVGARYFPAEEGFIRLRGLIGENDLSLGAGWIMPIRDNLRFEAIADFYFSVDFSIRGGLVYFLRGKK